MTLSVGVIAAFEGFEEVPRVPLLDLAEQAYDKVRSDPKEAIIIAVSVLDRTEPNTEVAARVLANRAKMMAYFYQGRPAEAIAAGRDAINEATRNGDLKARCDAQNDLARVFHSLDDVERSMELILAVIEGRHQLEDQQGVAAALNNLSIIHKNLEQYQQALRYAEQAIEIKRGLNDPKSLVASLTNTGNILLGLKRYQEALAHNQEALAIVKTLNEPITQAKVLNNIGNVHKAQGHFEDARDFFLESLALFGEDLSPSRVENLQQLGETYMYLGDLQKALDIAMIALDSAKDLNQNRLIRQGYLTKALIEEQQGNYQTALADFRQYQELQNQYLNDETNRRLSRMQSVFDADQQDRELKLLQAQSKLNAAKASASERELQISSLENRREILWRNVIIFFLIGSLITIALFWYSFTKSRLLEHERMINERLQQLDRMKDEFLANTSHELRTPLQGIIGLSESILDRYATAMPADCKDCIGMIVLSGRRLGNLVDDLLDFSKMKDHQLRLEQEAVDLHAMVSLVFTLLRPLKPEADIKLINEVPTDLPLVWADESRTQQVLHNLIGNALKFTDSGHITVTTEQEDDQILISITDTGIGIPASQQEAIFQSFSQVAETIHQNRGGSGLGLAVSSQIVKLHGSQLQLASKPGEGSRFYFSLPLAREEQLANRSRSLKDEVVRMQKSLAPRIHQVETVSKPKEPFHILIVDDEPVNRQVMVHQLHEFHVHQASNGRQALGLFASGQRFDLMLLDVMMPGLNGYEVCRQLRAQFESHELPIIILTAKTQIQDLREGFHAGANDFITKPFHREELLSRIRTHLQLLKANRRLSDYNAALQEDVKKRTHELETSAQKLRDSQKQLLEMAHMEGLAEFATSVLHSVGNELNSLTVSVQIMQELENSHTPLPLIEKIEKTLERKSDALEKVAAIDPFLSKLPQAIHLLKERIKDYREVLHYEWQQAHETVEMMRRIVESQKKYTNLTATTEKVKIATVIEEALEIKHQIFDNHNIKVHEDIGNVQAPQTSRYKLFRVLALLLDNACESLLKVTRDQRHIWINVFTNTRGRITIRLKDSGIGIPQKIATDIFRQGFTTKKNSSGLGLHYCATTMTELGGTLEFREPQDHVGAIFILELPLKLKKTTCDPPKAMSS